MVLLKIKVERKQTNLVKAIENTINDAQKLTLEVGWFENQKYPDGTNVAYAAAINEFGVPQKNIPARPFLRPTLAAERTKWMGILKHGLKLSFEGRSQYRSELNKLGSMMRADILKKIASIHEPPLKESTIRARESRRGKSRDAKRINTSKFVKPLNDTGRMIRTLTYHVKSK